MSNELRVVCVDNEDVLLMLASAFVREAFPTYDPQVRMGSNGNDLVRLVKEHKPHVIISDNNMDEKDGLVGIYELRKEGYRGKVLVTTGLLESAKKTAQELGIAADPNIFYLEKSYGRDTFVHAAREIWPEYAPAKAA